ncbi:hypothetical protein IFM89_037586 [Coptis chinensis]|uniref:Secoisolariciresinol dehydrogenase n=1 Tax=Coptis chinensis TaxID=261450 RepID=A0A835HBE4_9MAGN|nr:hypothetical protein IFM89_037586 [Coptis chinensis]
MSISGSTDSLVLHHQRLLGKVALVTGGAAGIGESIVKLFHHHGAKVCFVDVQDELGQGVCEALDGDSNVCFFHCNVANEDEMRRAIDFTVEKFGTLDILVNNAGICGVPSPDIRKVEISEFENVFDVNVKGVFIGMKHAARIMIPQARGSIVSVSSVASVIGGLGPHAYVGSKHAVVGLTKNVAAELGAHGIRVNCVSPYAVATPLALAHLPEEERTENAWDGFRAFVAKNANLQKVELTADDVADAVLYLSSDESRYISGVNLMEQYSCMKSMDGKSELEMLSFQAPKIRYLRSLSIEGSEAMKVLDFAVFPEPELDLPIFCANFFTAGSMNIIVLDLNPLHDVIIQKDYREKYYRSLMPLGLKYTEAWLELMDQAREEKDDSRILLNCEAQHKYLTWRAEKDPGHQVLKKLVGEIVAKDIVSNFLFNGINTLGSKAFLDYFPEYRCEDGKINQKRSVIGKSFQSRPWDAGGEFVGDDPR